MTRSIAAFLALLLLVVYCDAWNIKPTALITVRGGDRGPDDDEAISPPKKKRKTTNPSRDIAPLEEDDDEYAEEWFDGSQELSEDEEEIEGFIEEEDENEDDDEAPQSFYDAASDDDVVGEVSPERKDKEEISAAADVTNTPSSTASPAETFTGAAAAATTHHHDDDSTCSSADVDRLELADAYDDDVASLTADPPTIIDAATERILQKDLKYSPREIKQMKPAVAAVVASKRLHRPLEGMPRNWYISPPAVTTTKKQAIEWKRVVPRIVIPVAAGVLAISQRENMLDIINSALSSSRRSSDGSNQEVQEEDPYSLSSLLDEAPPPLEDHHKPHSIKPGTLPDDELDVTWLDKLLTAIERKIRAFLRLEI